MLYRRLRRIAAVMICGLSLAVAQSPGAQAQSVEQFYKGRTVPLIIPSATAGINDLSGRLVAKHIGRFIPGQPTIAPQNSPEKGGVGLLNDFAATTPRDGSVIAVVQRAAPMLAIQGDPARSSTRRRSPGSEACRPSPTTPTCWW